MSTTGTISRARIARRKAKTLGLALRQRGATISLYDDTGERVESGHLAYIEAYLADRFVRTRPGPPLSAPPAKWRPWIEAFIVEQNAAKRRPGTTRLRVMCLNAFARAHPGSDPLTVTRDHLVQYLGRTEWTPSTARSVRTTFRVFFRPLYDLGHRRDNPAGTLPAIKIPRSVPRPCPDHVVQEAYASIRDPRVRLAIRVAVETGMRRGEIARLRPADVVGRPGEYSLFVVGKGGHERTVPISDELASMLLAVPTVHVFPVFGGGPITADRLGVLIAQALPGEWTAHTLRHRFATMAYQASTDLRAVEELLGHVSPATTAIYTKVSDKSMRRAAAAAAL